MEESCLACEGGLINKPERRPVCHRLIQHRRSATNSKTPFARVERRRENAAICEKVDTSRQSQHYRQALTIPALNHLLTELDKRFNETNIPYIDALRLIPELMISPITKIYIGFHQFCNLVRS